MHFLYISLYNSTVFSQIIIKTFSFRTFFIIIMIITTITVVVIIIMMIIIIIIITITKQVMYYKMFSLLNCDYIF